MDALASREQEADHPGSMRTSWVLWSGWSVSRDQTNRMNQTDPRTVF